MCRHPIKDYAYSLFMTGVNKVHQILRQAVSWCCGKVSGNLIAPRAVVRIFHNRQHFDMSIAHFLNIRYKLLCHFSVCKEVAVIMHLPRAHMDLININRLFQNILSALVGLPICVVPFVTTKLIHLWARARSCFLMNCIRVCLHQGFARLCFYCILIAIININIINNSFPYSRCNRKALVCLCVPGIEITYNRNSLSVRCPYSKGNPTVIKNMISEKFIWLVVCSVMKKIHRKLVFLFNFSHIFSFRKGHTKPTIYFLLYDTTIT